ncbi:MAG: hypothetical protein BWY39_00098 [Spirochaetes bacterium ADurb.Bin269]|nr:MAG: hypothetical protein BWY39_00098 [Spirochaetes bacterium ADurb.Bin269]
MCGVHDHCKFRNTLLFRAAERIPLFPCARSGFRKCSNRIIQARKLSAFGVFVDGNASVGCQFMRSAAFVRIKPPESPNDLPCAVSVLHRLYASILVVSHRCQSPVPVSLFDNPSKRIVQKRSFKSCSAIGNRNWSSPRIITVRCASVSAVHQSKSACLIVGIG